MIELFDDFRDILVELHEAGARFVDRDGAAAIARAPRAQDKHSVSSSSRFRHRR
jgi:hypothetical protein